MRRFIIIAATAVGLSGVAQADALEEQAKHDPIIAKIIQEEKAKGTYSHGYQPSDSDIAATRQILGAQIEIHLRKMGMSPDMAHKAIWAASHKPNSACAYWVRQLTADYDGGLDRPDYDENLVISIEHSGTCERKNLD